MTGCCTSASRRAADRIPWGRAYARSRIRYRACSCENYPLPEHVTAGRPNLGRPSVVSVRLSAAEHAGLQRAAAAATLPVSTLIRIWALDRLHAERSGGTLNERLARLEQQVFQDTA